MTREACKGWFTEETPSLILTTMSEWLSQRTDDPELRAQLTPSHSDSGWRGRGRRGAWKLHPGEWPAQPRASPSWARRSQDGREWAKGTVTRRLEWGQETCPLALARPWMGASFLLHDLALRLQVTLYPLNFLHLSVSLYMEHRYQDTARKKTYFIWLKVETSHIRI